MRKKRSVLGIIGVILFMVVGFILYYPLTDMKVYNKAKKYYINADYSNAIDEFYKVETFKDADLYIQKSKYAIACKKYELGEYIEAYKSLVLMQEKYLYDFEGYEEGDLKLQIEDCKNNIEELGKQYFDKGEYVQASGYWEISYGPYEAQNSICSMIMGRQGTLYDRSDFSKKIIINNTTITIETKGDGGVSDGVYNTYLQPYTNNIGQEVWGLFFEGRDIHLTLEEGTTMTTLVNNELNQMRFFYSMEHAIEANNQVETSKIKQPAIGMTAEEVRNSTWGQPKKINKTTYAWGVTEQWCYSEYRYIYLEDGIVTAISE